LQRPGSSGLEPENNKPNDNLLGTMISKFQDHFGQGWMTNENAVAVFLATMIRANTGSETIENIFDKLINNPDQAKDQAKEIIDAFRKQNLNQIHSRIDVLIMYEGSVSRVSDL